MDNREKTRWFKTGRTTTTNLSENVDAENGILRNVVLCQEGESKGHGTHLEKSFIQDIVKLAKGREIKSRFGHPNMSNEALGTYLGNFKNISYRENDKGIGQAIGDLHLAQSSKETPNGDLWNYVTKAAQEHPDMFGSSIVFKPGKNYYYNSEGEKVYGSYWKCYEAEDNPDKKVYETITELLATDLVDEGAATDSLFSASAHFNSDAYAVKLTTFLDENPQIFEFAQKHPDKLEPFFQKYSEYQAKKAAMKSDNDKKTAFSKFKEFGKTVFGSSFSASVEDEKEETTETVPETESKKSDAENAQLAAITKEIAELKAKNEELEKSNAEFKAKIKELSEQPAAEETVAATSEETSQKSVSKFDRIGAFIKESYAVHSR